MAERESLRESLRQVERELDDAHTALSNMRVTTEPMTAPEMTEIEQRRVVALGYIDAALAVIDEATKPRIVVRPPSGHHG